MEASAFHIMAWAWTYLHFQQYRVTWSISTPYALHGMLTPQYLIHQYSCTHLPEDRASASSKNTTQVNDPYHEDSIPDISFWNLDH